MLGAHSVEVRVLDLDPGLLLTVPHERHRELTGVVGVDAAETVESPADGQGVRCVHRADQAKGVFLALLVDLVEAAALLGIDAQGCADLGGAKVLRPPLRKVLQEHLEGGLAVGRDRDTVPDERIVVRRFRLPGGGALGRCAGGGRGLLLWHVSVLTVAVREVDDPRDSGSTTLHKSTNT